MNITNTPPDARIQREEAFARLLLNATRRPFVWGQHDCCTFAAACVKARTGRDALAGLARWGSALEAERLVRALGGLRAAVTARLGEPIAPLRACAGDVVLAVDPADPAERELLAVCNGSYLVVPAEAGLAPLPLTAGICAWRVA